MLIGSPVGGRIVLVREGAAMIVDLQIAATELENLVERALQGEEVVIRLAGPLMVRLVPHQPVSHPRLPGGATVSMSDDFDAPLGIL